MSDKVFEVLNGLAIWTIRNISWNKDWHFQRWHDFVLARRSTLVSHTYFGARIECELDDFIGKRLFFFRVWEPDISRVITERISPGDVVIDVGANIGYDSLLCSRLVGPKGKVVAIEASAAIFQRLQDNLRRNRATNVRAVNVAVSDREGELVLYSEEGNLGRTSSMQRGDAHAVETVKMSPLDTILSDDERSRVRLIKVDIEGGELPLLRRLVETLHLYPHDMEILVEMSEENVGEEGEVFHGLLEKGFSAFAVPNDYALKAYLHQTRGGPVTKITTLPKTQMDILFRRESAQR